MSNSGGGIANLGAKISFTDPYYRYEGTLKGVKMHNNAVCIVLAKAQTFNNGAPSSSIHEELVLNVKCLLTCSKCEPLTPQQIDDKTNALKFELLDDLANYYCSKELSDIQIKCQDETFDAHQLILSARSPVLKRMLESDMIEKKSNVIEIKEINSDIVRELLKYIYTGKCIINDVNADLQTVKQLFEAANMYQLDSLKAFCGEVLISSLIPDNALSLLLLGDMYNAEKLKKHALDKVINNLKTIRRSDEWKDCIKTRSDISADIIEAMADKFVV